MHKLFYWFSMGTIFSAFCIMLYAGYLLFYPFKPFVLRTEPAKVLTKKVIAGQDLIYEVDYCRHGAGSGKVTRTVVGDTFIPIPLVETVTKEGCGVNTIHLPIPEGATPGKYHLEVSAEFHPNALRSIVVRFQSEEFEIIKN